MPSCLPADLMTAGAGFLNMEPALQQAIRIRILCGIINGETMTCDPSTLAAQARCITCMDPRQMSAVEVSLLCQLAGGGGGGGMGNVSSGPANPAAPPGSGNGAYLNTTTNTFWVWNPVLGVWGQLL